MRDRGSRQWGRKEVTVDFSPGWERVVVLEVPPPGVPPTPTTLPCYQTKRSLPNRQSSPPPGDPTT